MFGLQEEDEPLLSKECVQSDPEPRFKYLSPKLDAIFVAAFDTRAGNIIEWSYPAQLDLKGAEFKALPSGAHNVQHDIITFEINGSYGYSVYALKQVDSVAERGARLKSVGVIGPHYLPLISHEDKLIEFATDCVESPGSYQHLIQYIVEHNESCPDTLSYELRPPSVGSVCDLFRLLGVNMFVIWKMMLLKRRILLQCVPPISRHCNYVMALSSLTQSQYCQAKPLFFVTVNDINVLHYNQNYLACTSDLVLKSKGSHIYDVYVTGTSVLNAEQQVVSYTQGDANRHSRLAEVVEREMGVRNTSDIDRLILSYFTQLTEDLFSTLGNVCSGDKKFTSSDLNDVRFHSSDIPYLQTLVDKLGYDIELIKPGCCEEHLKHFFS